MPSILRLAHAVGYRVVIGIASPDVATLDPAVVTLEISRSSDSSSPTSTISRTSE